jgi:AcrR family transcriptional regulator
VLLSREQIISTALELARTEGFRAVKRTRVAEILGVSNRAISYHVESKELLLRLVVERAVQSIVLPAPAPGTPWRDRLESHLGTWWTGLRQWPGLAEFMLEHPAGLAFGLAQEQRSILHEALEDAGLDDDAILEFLWIFGAFLHGLAQIANVSDRDPGFFDELGTVDAEVRRTTTRPTRSDDLSRTFANGVRTLVDGIISRNPPSAKSK